MHRRVYTVKLLHYWKVSEYDQEILQSNIADQPTAPYGRATEHKQ